MTRKEGDGCADADTKSVPHAFAVDGKYSITVAKEGESDVWEYDSETDTVRTYHFTQTTSLWPF